VTLPDAADGVFGLLDLCHHRSNALIGCGIALGSARTFLLPLAFRVHELPIIVDSVPAMVLGDRARRAHEKPPPAGGRLLDVRVLGARCLIVPLVKRRSVHVRNCSNFLSFTAKFECRIAVIS
jgi:hypothetical protein